MKPILYWLVTGCFVFFGYKTLGGNYQNMWQPTAFYMTLMPVICYFIYAQGFQGFYSFVKRLFAGKTNENDVEVIDTATALGVFFGAMACVFGFIQAIEGGNNTGLAHAFYSILYGMIPTMVFIPFKNYKGAKATKKLHLRALGYSAATVALVILGYYISKH